jgi:proteasome lid subunit RPN8/RPN11
VASPLLGNTFVARGLLSDQGRLGVLAVEGEHRNPRLDDLQVLLYARAAQEPVLAAWLGREATRAESPLISVGVGCNSETTVLADEDVSAHAAYFAQVLRSEAVQTGRSTGGQLFLSWLTTDQGFPALRTERLVVDPLLVLSAVNDPTWQVRLVPAVLETMQRELAQAAPRETGGVLLGRADYKTKTLHVTSLLLAPPDSQATAVCFFRGTQHLPQQVANLAATTGKQLGYIGEWHTHPRGPEAMSDTDHAAVRRFQAEFSRLTTPLPVFLFIITPTAHLAFVF